MPYETQIIKEGNLKLIVPKQSKINLSKKDPVFYNPVARTNRELTVAFLKTINVKKCLDLLSGSGAMGLTIANEIPKTEVTLNDANPQAVELIKKNAKLNKLKVKILNESANKLLKEIKKFDYIDIDPFGPPVPFIENAVNKTKYLAITSTDTSALSGTYPKACLRKYNAKPIKNEFMHETGIRIMIKRAQEFALKHNLSLTPVFSFNFERYSRSILKIGKNTDKIKENTGYISYCNSCLWRKSSKIRRKVCLNCGAKLNHAGKLWMGSLWNRKIVNKMLDTDLSHLSRKILQSIYEESKINTAGFYDLHRISKKLKKSSPKIDKEIKELRKKGFKASRTHFSPTGIRTNAEIDIFTSE